MNIKPNRKSRLNRFPANSLLIAAGICLAACSSWGQGEAKAPNWQPLFNGKDLSGWTIKGDKGKAWVKDGEIVCQRTANTTEHTFVCTTAKFEDFILESDCKLDGNFHSGFLLRCEDAPKDAKVRLLGYQVKIDPTPRKWTGGVFEDFGPTWNWMYSLANNAPARDAFKMNEWNHFRMEAIGPSIKVWVNGIPAANLINKKYPSGYIALKIHALPHPDPALEPVLIHFKNIRILTDNPAKFAQTMDIPAITVP
jgi:hypothetical protein